MITILTVQTIGVVKDVAPFHVLVPFLFVMSRKVSLDVVASKLKFRTEFDTEWWTRNAIFFTGIAFCARLKKWSALTGSGFIASRLHSGSSICRGKQAIRLARSIRGMTVLR